MEKNRRRLVTALAASLAPLPAVVRAQSDNGYTTLKKELPVESKDRIEVAEFFWYGCIHCYNIEPLLEAWLPKLPPDTAFRRIPAVFNARWAHDASIFYTFEVLGVLEKLHRPFFDAIHKNGLKSDNPDSLGEFLKKHGQDPRKFDATMKSFGVQSKVKRAAQLTAAAAIDGTPALAVHGRYTISTEQSRTREGMLATADRLIVLVRKSMSVAR